MLGFCTMAAASVVRAPPPTLAPLRTPELALGFDFGTSGARCVVLDAGGDVLCAPASYAWGDRERQQSAQGWIDALGALFDSIPADLRGRIARIAVSGTSGSAVLVDARSGEPAADRGLPRMYDFSVARQAGEAGQRALELIAAYVPHAHVTRAPTSTLAKLLAWHSAAPLAEYEVLAHQADFIAMALCGASEPTSDWHNALKLGYDVEALAYPDWLTPGSTLGDILAGSLPERVVRPGAAVGEVGGAAAARWGLREGCAVVGGSTDSISAFLASGAHDLGDGVSSLGSTLAIKMLSDAPVSDAARGVYSHRLGDAWLVGGASNVGCAVLREQRFTDEQLRALSADGVDWDAPPVHEYYPLPASARGERFPVADDAKAAVLTPVPANRAAFLHAILHAIARVEAEGYAALAALGARPLRRVYSCGGGAHNPQWTALRERMLGVPTSLARNADAAYGAALLAARGDAWP